MKKGSFVGKIREIKGKLPPLEQSMEKAASLILKGKWVVITATVLIIALSFVGLFVMLKNDKINSDMLAYIDKGFTTYDGLEFLKENFNINGDAMLAVEASEDDAESADIINGFAEIEGVTQLVWHGSVTDMEGMLSGFDGVFDIFGISKDDFLSTQDFKDFLRRPVPGKEGSYYYVVMMLIEHSSSTDAAFDILDEMEKRLGDRPLCTAGMTSVARMVMRDTLGEMPLYLVFGFLAVIVILLLTTTSFIEPLILIFTLVIAVIVNLGSNALFPSVSIISFAASGVLQLGVTMDYAIFFMHIYKEKRKNSDPFNATLHAAPRVWQSVLASGLTTIGGFAALYCMRYTLGADIANVVIKGVVLSLLTVIIVQPCLCVLLDKVILKTSHKRVIRFGYGKLADFSVKRSPIMLIVAALLVIPAFFGQSQVKYSYFQIYDTQKRTEGVEGVANEMTNQFIVAVPVQPNEGKTHKGFIEDVEKLDKVQVALGAFKAVNVDEKAMNFLLDNTRLLSDGYAASFFRKVGEGDDAKWYTLYTIGISGSAEDDASFVTYGELEKLLAEYFPESYELGMLTGVGDMSCVTPTDFRNVTLVSIVIVLAVVVLMMASFKKGILTVVLIELAIWLNLSISAIFNQHINFIIYILISSVQLGCTIDYAILIAGKFKEEMKRLGDAKEAAKSAMKSSCSAVVTSASIIIAVTLSVVCVSRNMIVQDMASLLARGGFISLVLVLCVLPGILILSEKSWMPAFLLRKKKNRKKKTAEDEVALKENNEDGTVA